MMRHNYRTPLGHKCTEKIQKLTQIGGDTPPQTHTLDAYNNPRAGAEIGPHDVKFVTSKQPPHFHREGSDAGELSVYASGN